MSALAYKVQYPAAPRLELLAPYVETAPACGRVVATSIFWRRRIAVLMVMAVLAVGTWSVAGAGVELVRQHFAGAPAASETATAASSHPQVWTVRPGDTLWSIARSIKPTGDIRPVLDVLIKKYQDRPLSVGDTLTVP